MKGIVTVDDKVHFEWRRPSSRLGVKHSGGFFQMLQKIGIITIKTKRVYCTKNRITPY